VPILPTARSHSSTSDINLSLPRSQGWLAEPTRRGGNLDIARHDRALRELLGDRLRRIIGD